jgi:hypothetical protein
MFASLKFKSIALLGLATCVVLAACNKNDDSSTLLSTRENTAVIAQQTETERKAEARIAALSVDELRKLASTAFREQRLHSPAGNNA